LRGLYNGIVWVAENVLKRFYIDLPRTIVGWIGNAAGWLVEKGKDILRGLYNGIVSFAQTVWDWFTNIPSVLWGLFKDAATWLIDAGRRIVKGLYDGIVKAPYNITQALADKVPGGRHIFGDQGLGDLTDEQWEELMRRTGRRALGGPVAAGRPYIVGEGGPELFVPHQAGQIAPNHRLGGAAGLTLQADTIVFGERGAISDLDWWWRTQGAGV